MVSPFSGWVLAAAALLSSPAWHAALVAETLSLETAAVRFGIVLLVVRGGLSMLGSLVQGTSPAPRQTETDPLALPPGDGPLPGRPAGTDPTSAS